MKSFRGGLAAWVGVVVMAHGALADVVAIDAAKDNTLYEDPNGQISNGSGSYFFAGTTAIGEVRRGVIAFDIAGNVPAGVTITGARLTLHMSRTIVGDVDVGLHRVEADWGEGASDAFGEEGFGAPAEPGDATWIHTFFDTAFWTSAGGDFSGNARDVQAVGDVGFYTWGSTGEMVADVQEWLDDPSSNFGWLLLADESNFPTAKRFDTRENADLTVRPVLTVTFLPLPVNISATRDNTLYEDPDGGLSNGAGAYFFAGTTLGQEIRRGLIAFDIDGNVPPGATITGASLTLNMSRTIAGDVDVGLHRVEADWGEGASDASGQEGGGAPAEPGDATWIHTFFDTAFWANVGGDFSLNASAVQIIGGLGFYKWESTEGLVADVQAWLNDPLNNFGWLLLADETSFPTAKRFDTKDNINPDVHPVLTVEFTPPGDCDGDGDADLDDFAAFLNCFTGPDAGPVDPECECADIDGDGDADFDDFALFQLAFTG